MPENDGTAPDPRLPDSGDSSGLGETATGVIASVIDYLHARLELLALEAREAQSELVIRIVAGAIGIFFLLIFYLAACVALIGWASEKSGWPWPATTAALAALHLLIALVLLLVVRRKFHRKPFRDSLNEWEKDRAWLNRHRNRKTGHRP